MIFDDAWKTSVPEAPPCKLLDTAWARRRWRSIEIITLNDLKDLLSLLETAPHRAPFIRILVFAEYALEYEGLDEATEEKRDALLAGPLRALFSLVGPSLTDLDASEADKVSTCVHLYGLLDLLPKLEALEISGAFFLPSSAAKVDERSCRLRQPSVPGRRRAGRPLRSSAVA
jgi:hypothetical protein